MTVRRLVTVTRPTPYDTLLADHGTRGQVAFVLTDRGQDLDALDREHAAHLAARRTVAAATPTSWRRAHVDRSDLDRFLFEPDDIVVVIGPDGLVPNVAKYLEGQPVIGVAPDGIGGVGRLVTLSAGDAGAAMLAADAGSASVRELTMVRAVLDDGRELRALNEVFVGHRTHQSARYTLAIGDREEAQSSSGLIVATGTGATGWASSIHRATGCDLPLPTPTGTDLLLLVREAWPSPTTGVDLVASRVDAGAPARITSRIESDGIVFGDGIESDPLPFDLGRTVSVSPADTHLRLVVDPATAG